MSVWISLHGDMSHEDNESPDGFAFCTISVWPMSAQCNVTTPPFLPGIAHERVSVSHSWMSESTLGKVRTTIFTAGNSCSYPLYGLAS